MRASSEVSPVASNRIARQILREMSDGVLIIDEDSVIVEANSAAQALIGTDRTELVGSDLQSALDGSSLETLLELIDSLDSALEDSTPARVVIRRADGATLRTEFSASHLKVDSQTFCMLVIRDVTLEFETRERLREAEEQVAESQLLAGIASLQFFPRRNRLVYSDALLKLLELPVAVNATADGFLSLIHSQDRDSFNRKWNRLCTSGKPFDTRTRLKLGDGGTRHFECNAQITEAATDGTPTAIVVILRDITDELHSRMLASEHEENLRKLDEVFEALEGFAWEFDIASNAFTYVSPRVTEVLGYPAEDWIGDPAFFPGVLHPEDRDWVLSYCATQTSQGADHAMTYRMIAADGEIHWFRDVVYLDRREDGSVSGLRGLMIDISDSARLREELRQSEEHYQKIFNESPVGLLELDWSDIKTRLDEIIASGVTDPGAWLEEHPNELAALAQKGRILAANQSALRMYEAEQLEGFLEETGSVFRSDSLPAFKQHLVERLSGVRDFSCENVNYTLNGKRLHVSVSATPASGSEDSWKLLFTSVADITEHKHAELLRDGQQRVLRHLASEPDIQRVMCTLTAELEQQSPYLRAAAFRVTPGGQSLQTVSAAATAQELVTLIDSLRVDSLFGTPDSYKEVTIRPDSTQPVRSDLYPPGVPEAITRTARLCGYSHGILKPVFDQNGNVAGLLAVFRTEDHEFSEHELDAISSFSHLTALVFSHDRGRRALVSRTEELQSIFESYPDALVRIASDGTILESYSGNRLSEILRLSEIGTQQILWYLLPGKAALDVRDAVVRAAGGSRMETVEFDLEHNDQTRHFEARLLSLPAENELIAVLRDVTQLKQTQLELSQVSERFRYLFDNSPDAIFVESLDGRVLDANQAACELHLLPREELVNRSVNDLVPADEHEAAAERTIPLMTGDMTQFESRSLRSDGSIIPVGVRSTTVTYDGEPALLLHVRDITEQLIAEERKREQERHLAHVSRLTMMGQLVAGIAHEIRQPLWSLSTFADVCAEALNRPDAEERLPQVREFAAKLVTESRRVHAITTRMFAFARKGKPERTEAELSAIIEEAIGLTTARARGTGIRTTTDLDEHLPKILCDRVLIEQTIVNLLNNAYEALSSSRKNDGQVDVAAFVDSEDPEFVTVTVTDNGPGLPEGIEPEQLFEGFFTTGHTGLGIGLALSRSFVEDHGGWIQAESVPAGGMRFEFTLKLDGGTPADADRPDS